MATRDFSDVQENAVAKALGGHRTANSGATTFSKGDVIVGNVSIECKTKMSPCGSFSVQKSWIDTLERERVEMRKSASAIAISFDAGNSSFYVINEKMMKRLVELINEED